MVKTKCILLYLLHIKKGWSNHFAIIVIENPGGFPEGITEHNIITHPSVPRNKLIVETLQRLKYVQRTGQSVDIIFRDMVSSGKPYPEYREQERWLKKVLIV